MKTYKRYSQRNKRWSRLRLSPSVLNIGGHGCLLTNLSSACNTTPDVLVRKLQFTDDDHKYGGGLIFWNDHNKKIFRSYGLEYIGRYMSWTEEDFKLNKKYSKDDDYTVITEVATGGGDRHWLLNWNWGYLNKPVCYNPWDGGILYNPWGFLGRYPRPTGWLLFERI